MYLPRHFQMNSLEAQHGLMRRYPFASLITATATGFDANPLPLLLHASEGENGVLRGHVARANPLCRQVSTHAMALFQGPQAYITPSWYPAKSEHGKVVPTWHYLTLQAHGRLRWIDDADWLRQHVAELTARFEHDKAVPWSIEDAPADYIDGMCRAIVGIELTIERLVGKQKAAQHKDAATQQAVMAGLMANGVDSDSAAWLSGASMA